MIPHDKQDHIFASFIIAVTASWVAAQLTRFGILDLDQPTVAGVGFVVALTAGVAKEAFDKFSGTGSAEWGDLTADVVGASAGFIIVVTF